MMRKFTALLTAYLLLMIPSNAQRSGPATDGYDLKADQAFPDRVVVKWTDSFEDETGFRLFKSSIPSLNYASQVELGANTTSYEDHDVVADKTYYYWVAALHDDSSDTVSEYVSVSTPSIGELPLMDSLTLNGYGYATSLHWARRSLNVLEHIVERASIGSDIWYQVGTAPYDATSYTDPYAKPGEIFQYRLVAVGEYGSATTLSIEVRWPGISGSNLGKSIKHGGVKYFLFSEPSRVERYDLESGNWLEPILFPTEVADFAVDSSGIFTVSNEELDKLSLDGSQVEMVTQWTNSTTTGGAPVVAADDSNILLYKNGYLFAFDKFTRDQVGEYDFSGESIYYPTFEFIPQLNRVYFQSRPHVNFFIKSENGYSVSKGWDLYDLSYFERLFVSPNGDQMITDMGDVMSIEDESEILIDNIEGGITDITYNGNLPVVLRGNTLVAYDDVFQIVGKREISGEVLNIDYSNGEIVVFIEDETSLHGMRIVKVMASDLSSRSDYLNNGAGLQFAPDQVLTTSDDTLLLLSRKYKRVFRWSFQDQKYISPLVLPVAPDGISYDLKYNKLYVYGLNHVNVFDLNQGNPEASLYYGFEGNVSFFECIEGICYFGYRDLVASSGGVVAIDVNGDVIDLIDGDTPSFSIWDRVRRRIYLTDSASDIMQVLQISADGGVLSKSYKSWFNQSIDYRLCANEIDQNGEMMIFGGEVSSNSVVVDIANSSILGEIPYYIDAAFSGENILALTTDQDQSILNRWTGTDFSILDKTWRFEGEGMCLAKFSDGSFAIVTLCDGVPRIYRLNDLSPNGSNLMSSPPKITDTPPKAYEDELFSWTPMVTGGTGVTSIQPIELPAWLTYSEGIFWGIPDERYSGDRSNGGEDSLLTVRVMDERGGWSDQDFNIHVAWENDPPVFQGDASVIADIQGSHSSYPVAMFLTDPDGSESFQWKIASVSNPAIFKSITLTQQGSLDIEYNSRSAGSSRLMIEVSDLSGKTASQLVTVALPEVDSPQLALSELEYTANESEFLQVATIYNQSYRPLEGVDLILSNVASNVSVKSASVDEFGIWYLHYDGVIGVDESVEIPLVYLAENAPSVEGVAISALPGHAKDLGDEVNDRFTVYHSCMMKDDSFVLDFSATPGKIYQISYSDDGISWTPSPIYIIPDESVIRWNDFGPPWTNSAPVEQLRRFYRVEQIGD
ncbi:hypothetical protein JIN85_13895 [Luteolibacter pohnpeiensis]|uniref:Fibronectin type-III domain-containing protein n=1 Tax=Luteolibacter pohnpeiensis TaxID=454153 RepID=A0A934S8X5_9BACT|nr:hypothetical protein [Luteolibacter pohnpeiensis]MBK1883515.1 hypothetical protein [Luteolibacter pohnpeiensis]